MTKLNKALVKVFSILLLSISQLAVSAEQFEAQIQARQAFMQVLKFNIGILGDMAKGNRDYDAKLAESSAKNIHAASLMDNSAMWPQGSDNAAKLAVKTDALPQVWSNYPGVVEKHTAWIEASASLSANAGKGLDKLRQHIGAVGKSCQGCHKSFRADK